VFWILVLAAAVLTLVDGPDLQGHHDNPAHRPLHNFLVLLFLVAKVMELQMEVWWLKHHPEAR
jgi:hypothetical protein